MAGRKKLTEEERIEHARISRQKWAEKQKALKTAGTEPKKPVTVKVEEKPTVDYSNYVPKAQFETLQQSYIAKCRELDKIALAYKRLALRYSKAGELAKQFVNNTKASIDLLFPDNHIEGDN